MTVSGGGDTGAGRPAIDAFERIADAQREVRSSGAGEPFDRNPGDDAELDEAIAHLERLVDALAGLVVASPDASGEAPLAQMVVAFDNAEIEAQASVLLTDLWNTADGALRLVENEIAQIDGADVAPQLSDWARRLRQVGRSAEEVAAGFSRFVLDQAAVASTAPMASELDESSDSGDRSSGQTQPSRASATLFVASLLDLVARIAGVARSVSASRAAAAPGPAPRVVFLPPLLEAPEGPKVRGDVAEPAHRELVLDPPVRRGQLPFDRDAAGKQVAVSWDQPREGRARGRRSVSPVLGVVALSVLGASVIGVLILAGGGDWQRLLGAVGFPSTTPMVDGGPNGSPPAASGSVTPGDGSAVPGSEAPGTTGGATNAPGGPTPGPGQTPNPTPGPTSPGSTSTPGPSGPPSPTPDPSGSPTPSTTPGPTGPPPTPGPSPTPTPTPTPTLDPAAAAQEFANRVSTGATSVGALLDSISAALTTFDWAAISAAASDLAALADSETAWLQSHPPALCYEPEHGDALAAYLDLRIRADAIIAAANVQDPSGIPYLVAKGKQDRAALNQAANQAPGGC